MTYIKCCEHNRCPDKPKHFLRRFEKNPWRCPQCGRWWVSEYIVNYGGGFYTWKEIKGPDEKAKV